MSRYTLREMIDALALHFGHYNIRTFWEQNRCGVMVAIDQHVYQLPGVNPAQELLELVWDLDLYKKAGVVFA